MEIFQDWAINAGNPKGRMVMLLFRIAFAIRNGPKPLIILALPFGIFYRLAIEWILGIELPWKTQVGRGLRLEHGLALVVNDKTTFGCHCLIRHSTTIGNRELRDGTYSGAPKIGNYVHIGANCVILGDITIGDHVIIGAGSVVTKNIPPFAVIAGNPAKIIRMIDPTSSTANINNPTKTTEPLS